MISAGVDDVYASRKHFHRQEKARRRTENAGLHDMWMPPPVTYSVRSEPGSGLDDYAATPAPKSDNPPVGSEHGHPWTVQTASEFLKHLRASIERLTSRQSELELTNVELGDRTFELRAEVEDMETRHLELSSAARNLEVQRTELQGEINTARIQLHNETSNLATAHQNLSNAQSQLNTTTDQLSKARLDTSIAQAQLKTCRSDLTSAQSKLVKANKDHTDAVNATMTEQDLLRGVRKELGNARQDLSDTHSRLKDAVTELANMERKLLTTKENVRTADDKARALKASINQLGEEETSRTSRLKQLNEGINSTEQDLAKLAARKEKEIEEEKRREHLHYAMVEARQAELEGLERNIEEAEQRRIAAHVQADTASAELSHTTKDIILMDAELRRLDADLGRMIANLGALDRQPILPQTISIEGNPTHTVTSGRSSGLENAIITSADDRPRSRMPSSKSVSCLLSSLTC